MGEIELVVKGRLNDQSRGFYRLANGVFQSDREDEQHTLDQLLSFADSGSELTFTAVPIGTSVRIGVDRDEDGFFDRDELDLCSNPADSQSVPETDLILGDVNNDGAINLLDIAPFVDAISTGNYIAAADINCDTFVNLLDVEPFIDLLTGN
jgi:hypothetical protein